ncbi:hypothetical protein C6N75_04560 [Streptomyces solincola]|uniref:Uncharacterized protein n=1 Tax=Streptomyces solincola TaxID=2100817 RepID=A0A2S9Q107_9ACTN|nr:hypothetical protein C6N75_04560 [Streptomyces solincola]
MSQANALPVPFLRSISSYIVVREESSAASAFAGRAAVPMAAREMTVSAARAEKAVLLIFGLTRGTAVGAFGFLAGWI